MHEDYISIEFRGNLDNLKKLLCGTPCPQPQPDGFDFKVSPPQSKGKCMHLDLLIDTTQKINLTVTNPGDAAPIWTVESGDSTILVQPDGLSADLISSDFPGETIYSVRGTRAGAPINDSITLTVMAAPPGQDFGLVAGLPVPKNATAFAKKV